MGSIIGFSRQRLKEGSVSTYEVLLWLSLALQTAAIIIEMLANRLLQ
jgi:hypothetical protein